MLLRKFQAGNLKNSKIIADQSKVKLFYEGNIIQFNIEAYLPV